MPITFYDEFRREVSGISIKDKSIFRYLNIDGVINSLKNQQLRLTRFDSSHNDLDEGKLSPGFIAVDEEINAGISNHLGIPAIGNDRRLAWAEKTNREKCFFVSWSLINPLKEEMWEKYTTSTEACAFQMTPETLKEAINEELDKAAIGETFYQDPNDRQGSSIDFTRELFRKNPKHNGDREVRLVMDTRWAPSKFDKPTGPDFPKHSYLNFDLSKIERIYFKKGVSIKTYFEVAGLLKIFDINTEIVLLK